MSGKSTKKPKTLSVPREMAEIQKAYQDACLKAGQIQYQIKVYAEELNKTNDALVSLNNEGAARQQLDQQKTRETQDQNKGG